MRGPSFEKRRPTRRKLTDCLVDRRQVRILGAEGAAPAGVLARLVGGAGRRNPRRRNPQPEAQQPPEAEGGGRRRRALMAHGQPATWFQGQLLAPVPLSF